MAELEARRAEAEAASKEQESMMKRSLCEHQERIREQKELIERLKMEHQGAMALAQEELTMMKGKINSQKEMGKDILRIIIAEHPGSTTTHTIFWSCKFAIFIKCFNSVTFLYILKTYFVHLLSVNKAIPILILFHELKSDKDADPLSQ